MDIRLVFYKAIAELFQNYKKFRHSDAQGSIGFLVKRFQQSSPKEHL